MKKFEVPGHMGDLKIEIYADSPENLFKNSPEALSFVMKPETEGNEKVYRLTFLN